MKDTYLQVLEYLESWGIDREVDISDKLYEWFRAQPDVDPKEHIDNLNSRIAHFCDEMHENRHIRLFKELTIVNGQNRWHVIARLTFFGKQYCITERQIQADRTIADNSVIQAKSSLRQTEIFKWTAIFAFGAIILSGLSLWKDFHKDTQQQQLKQKDSLIKQLQKKIYRLKIDSSRLPEEVKTSPKKS